MKIERHLQPETEVMHIEEFADKHDLVMVVNERPKDLPVRNLPRFYARFKNAETKNRDILAGSFGNGESEEEAICEYAKEISGKLLVIDAMTPQRREIQVPTLI